MNFNLVLTTVIFCVVAQEVYAERLPSDTKILMDTCYDVMPNCKNDYFAARSKDLKRWCCIRIVDEYEDVNDFEKMNSNAVLTTHPTTTTTTKKNKKSKSKKSDGTKEKKKKKHKKSRKSKSKTSKVKENEKHLMTTENSGSRWTTILTEFTKKNRTEAPKHMSIVKDNRVISTPSYFSLPKHTHITEHVKTMKSSNMQAGLSGVTTLSNVPVTTISESNSTPTTTSSTPLTPSSQSISSTVSTANQDINTTSSSLSIISTSRLITSTSDKSNSESIRTESDYEKTSLIPDTTVVPFITSSTLVSSSLATASKKLSTSTTDPIFTINTSSKLISSLSTDTQKSYIPTKTTTKPFIKPHHWDHFKASNIRAGDSSEEESGEELPTLTTRKTTIETSPSTKSSPLNPKTLSSIVTDQDIEVTASNRPVTTISMLSHSSEEVSSLKGSTDPNNEGTSDISVTSKKPTTESLSLSTVDTTTSIVPIKTTTEPFTKPSSSTVNHEATESEKSLNPKASPSIVTDQNIEVTASTTSMLSAEPNSEGTITITETSIKPTTESTSSINTSSKLISSLSTVDPQTSYIPTKTTTKPFIKPHHWDHFKASNIRAGDSSEEESGEELTTLTTQKTTIETSPSTKSSTFSSSYSDPLILSEVPSNLNIDDTPGKSASERHLGSSEKIENVTESSSSSSSTSDSSSTSSSSNRPVTITSKLSQIPEEVLSNGSTEPNSEGTSTISVTSNKSTTLSINTVDTTTSIVPTKTTTEPFTKPHSWDIEDTPTKSASERHLGSSEQIENDTESPSSTPRKVESTSSTVKLSPFQSDKIDSTIESPSSASFTSIEPESLSTLQAVQKDSVAKDFFSNKPSSSLQGQKDPEVGTTILSIPATPKTFSSSSVAVNSTILNLIKSSLLSTETPFPTASSAPKILNSGKLTQSSESFESFTTSLTKQNSTIAPATTISNKLNHAMRLDDDDDDDEDSKTRPDVEENDKNVETAEATAEEPAKETVEETVEETAVETPVENAEENAEESEEETEKKFGKPAVVSVNVKGRSKRKSIPKVRKPTKRRINLAVKV